ncbi:unnamed protein product [Nesidiocoris tenuis]|uniref:Translocon-associated protein subunit alpha n=1 Tax=Nesidiocoris tenuis TaxID=355587 RepID=A0A6H5FYB8_9HEMI|nr:unnamed protein product [Nesidiocoris tenuis]
MKYLLLFLAVPALIFSISNPHFGVRAEEDDVEDDLVDVEGEETAVTGDDATEEEEAPADSGQTGSPDAQTTMLFTKPIVTPGTPLDLPGGVLVEFLVGFKNNGPQDFVLETLDASFRYPMDFNFYIQNFTTLAYERTVKPSQEATLFYSFVPAEAFAGRPFGLSVNLRYRDVSGNQFYEGVYNETVNIIELDEGIDGEMFFLSIFLGACAVLLLVLGQQLLLSVVQFFELAEDERQCGADTFEPDAPQEGTDQLIFGLGSSAAERIRRQHFGLLCVISGFQTAVVRGTKLGFKHMGKDNGGSGGIVINIASITSFIPWDPVPVYSGTKAFVNQMSRSYGPTSPAGRLQERFGNQKRLFTADLLADAFHLVFTRGFRTIERFLPQKPIDGLPRILEICRRIGRKMRRPSCRVRLRGSAVWKVRPSDVPLRSFLPWVSKERLVASFLAKTVKIL